MGLANQRGHGDGYIPIVKCLLNQKSFFGYGIPIHHRTAIFSKSE